MLFMFIKIPLKNKSPKKFTNLRKGYINPQSNLNILLKIVKFNYF